MKNRGLHQSFIVLFRFVLAFFLVAGLLQAPQPVRAASIWRVDAHVAGGARDGPPGRMRFQVCKAP